MRDWVVDASVGIKLFVVEDLSEAAEQLFRGLVEDPPSRLYVPDLFYLECANILWKYVRRFGYPLEAARQDIEALSALALLPVSAADLLGPTLDLAVERGITSYDASYAVLAKRLEVPLVTADRPLIRKLEGSGVEVCWLGALEGR
ncbi:MAG TPA: type II toxin-antitoxin system VapC family toxin [Thermoanaerobaculia bacterium]|nr:type II toxin-antitoxin system VapC family toxin [Thermoanaerobaculia bacterium]